MGHLHQAGGGIAGVRRILSASPPAPPQGCVPRGAGTGEATLQLLEACTGGGLVSDTRYSGAAHPARHADSRTSHEAPSGIPQRPATLRPPRLLAASQTANPDTPRHSNLRMFPRRASVHLNFLAPPPTHQGSGTAQAAGAVCTHSQTATPRLTPLR